MRKVKGWRAREVDYHGKSEYGLRQPGKTSGMDVEQERE